MRPVLLFVMFLSLWNCTDAKPEQKAQSTIDATKKEVAKTTTDITQSEIPIYIFSEFEPLLHVDDGKTYVVNFWATWCKPCIKEMPYFEKLAANYKDKGVEVLFVSLDFPRLLEKQVVPFIKENNIKSRVVLLDDTGANEWIPKVDKDWSGAIPATVIYNSKGRNFYEQSFDYNQLETALKEVLNQ